MNTRIDPRDPKDTASYERLLAESQRNASVAAWRQRVQAKRQPHPIVFDRSMPAFLRRQAV